MSGFQFPPRVYDFMKMFVLIWLPAFSAFYFAVGNMWGFPAVDKVPGTLAALAVLLGTMVGISKSNYDKSDRQYDGSVLIEQDPETGVRLNIDLRGATNILDKDKLVLKMPKLEDLPDIPPEDPR